MRYLLLLGAIALLFIFVPSLLPPTNFEDYVLKELKGVNNSAVAKLKAGMCDNKFPDHK